MLKKYKTILPLRLEESKLIRDFASACIDTSDGVLNALITLYEINGVGLEIDKLPFIPAGLTACKILSKSKLCLFAGECGEYELLFSIPMKDENLFLSKASTRKLKFQRLGEASRGKVLHVSHNGDKLDFSDYNLSARSFNTSEEYLDTLEEYLKEKQKLAK